MVDNVAAVAATPPLPASNADPAELAKFSALAHRWWDPQSEFKPLHDINPLRLGWIDAQAGGLAGKRVADVGCGGGILAEAMAARGAQVSSEVQTKLNTEVPADMKKLTDVQQKNLQKLASSGDAMNKFLKLIKDYQAIIQP